ncbi:MAG: hypothetical protein ABR540_11960 [Acidimicrobiales bacterium]|nr:hypothetical protein [Actinomycetota bacterium]
MTPPVSSTTGVDAAAARAAVVAMVAPVTSMLRNVTRPNAPALGEWDLTEVAVHLSHSLDAISGVAKGGGSILKDIWDLPKLSGALVGGEAERDLGKLADRIEATVAEFIPLVGAADEGVAHAWLIGGIQFPVSTLVCQALNELVVHGYDIAQAEGAPWPIDRAHATLILLGFVFPALNSLGGAMVEQEAAGDTRAILEVRLRGGGRAYFHFDRGDFAITDGPGGRVDCHLSVDPVAFMLVAWGRTSQWPAIARGQLLAWGRRPWLGLKLRGMLRNP